MILITSKLESLTCAGVASSVQLSGEMLQDLGEISLPPLERGGGNQYNPPPTSFPSIHFILCMGTPEELAGAL